MTKKYTYLDLCIDILSKDNTPMTPYEIWEKAIKLGLNKNFDTVGKTPAASIGARIYVDIKENGENSIFSQYSKRPARFVLRSKCIEKPKEEIELTHKNKINDESKKGNNFHERDLHPLLVKYVYQSSHFKGYVKTIHHENSVKKAKGVNEWLHPDLVGVYFPFNDYTKETTALQNRLNVNSIRLFSFEMKKDLNFNNLREYYFQAVSNSSWANEGYLVALKIDENTDFKNEMQRLSNAFGIGIIKLDAENIDESEIICPAHYNEIIDWDTLNRLAENSPDFKTFISDISDTTSINRIISENFDKVFNEEEYIKHLKDKKII